MHLLFYRWRGGHCSRGNMHEWIMLLLHSYLTWVSSSGRFFEVYPLFLWFLAFDLGNRSVSNVDNSRIFLFVVALTLVVVTSSRFEFFTNHDDLFTVCDRSSWFFWFHVFCDCIWFQLNLFLLAIHGSGCCHPVRIIFGCWHNWRFR